MYLRQEEKDRIMEQNENNKVQVALSPYHTGGIQDGYDLDRILFDLDSQIELYTAHPDARTCWWQSDPAFFAVRWISCG